ETKSITTPWFCAKFLKARSAAGSRHDTLRPIASGYSQTKPSENFRYSTFSDTAAVLESHGALATLLHELPIVTHYHDLTSGVDRTQKIGQVFGCPSVERGAWLV